MFAFGNNNNRSGFRFRSMALMGALLDIVAFALLLTLFVALFLINSGALIHLNSLAVSHFLVFAILHLFVFADLLVLVLTLRFLNSAADILGVGRAILFCNSLALCGSFVFAFDYWLLAADLGGFGSADDATLLATMGVFLTTDLLNDIMTLLLIRFVALVDGFVPALLRRHILAFSFLFRRADFLVLRPALGYLHGRALGHRLCRTVLDCLRSGAVLLGNLCADLLGDGLTDRFRLVPALFDLLNPAFGLTSHVAAFLAKQISS